MKYLILITIFLCLSLQTLAVTSDATQTATVAPTKNQQVEDLKERLATKVAQLRQSEKRAIYGTVKTTSISTLTVETTNKNIKIELTDDIKVFQNLKGKRTALTIEDIAKNDIVSVFGDWDTAIEVLKAKVIFIHNSADTTKRIYGTITEAKKSDYTVSVTTQDEKTYIVDFETTTKTNVWSKDKGMEKGGFSRLLPGDTIMVVGTDVPKKENRISALRILDIGNLTGITPVVSATPTEKEASSASTKTTTTPTKSPTPKQ